MDEFSHLKSKLLAEQVEEQIYHYILDTPLDPGSKLPNEFELGEKFGVGRSTIREAVKLLSSKGIVEVRRGSGDPGQEGTGAHPTGLRVTAQRAAVTRADIAYSFHKHLTSVGRQLTKNYHMQNDNKTALNRTDYRADLCIMQE